MPYIAKEKQRLNQKKRYDALKTAGLCTACGKEKAKFGVNCRRCNSRKAKHKYAAGPCVIDGCVITHVHHVNGNHKDNRPENLVPLNPVYHELIRMGKVKLEEKFDGCWVLTDAVHGGPYDLRKIYDMRRFKEAIERNKKHLVNEE